VRGGKDMKFKEIKEALTDELAELRLLWSK
jgi:hypothetical protein